MVRLDYHGLHGLKNHDRLKSSEVSEFYIAGCRHLEHLRGERARRTYRYEDEEGYPSVASIVQFSNDYFAVTAFEGNDRSGVHLSVSPGPFPPSDERFPKHFLQVKELPNDHAPGWLTSPQD